jgi:uncharacterized protein (DUF1501 family)
MLTRRDFLKRSSLIALAPTVPAFLARTARAVEAERDGRVLVVIQLDGGNDGINTVVPYADEGYARHRKQLRLPADRLLKLNDQVGLHPSFAQAAKLLEAQQLAIVQGVGYPNPSRSHAQSMAIWHTARLDPEEHAGPGWIGRALDGAATPPGRAAGSLLVGTQGIPAALRGRRSVPSALARLEDLNLSAGPAEARPLVANVEGDDLAAFVHRSLLDAYATADRLGETARASGDGSAYPGTTLANRLRTVARLLKADFAARVYYVIQPGYDTHANQLPAHASLLGEWAGAVQAFFLDLAAARLAERVAVLSFSEFGRQVRENASAGTDHGTVGPVFLAGPGVRGGLAGTTPRLTDLPDGEPRMSVDFRQVYATVLGDWLGLATYPAVGGSFDRLPLFSRS